MYCSLIEYSMTSLSFQIAVQKNEAKLSSFVQFEDFCASDFQRAMKIIIIIIAELFIVMTISPG